MANNTKAVIREVSIRHVARPFYNDNVIHSPGWYLVMMVIVVGEYDKVVVQLLEKDKN